MSLEDYRTIMPWLFGYGALAAFAFFFFYSLWFLWWRSSIGRHLVLTRVSIGMALGLAFAGSLGINFPGMRELFVVVVVLIDIALTWSVILVLGTRWRQTHTEQMNRDESIHGHPRRRRRWRR